jgi:hypothetical protein
MDIPLAPITLINAPSTSSDEKKNIVLMTNETFMIHQMLKVSGSKIDSFVRLYGIRSG